MKTNIKDMIIDLKNENYNLNEDAGNYTDHWDAGIYYSKYLYKILQNNEPEIFYNRRCFRWTL